MLIRNDPAVVSAIMVWENAVAHVFADMDSDKLDAAWKERDEAMQELKNAVLASRSKFEREREK